MAMGSRGTCEGVSGFRGVTEVEKRAEEAEGGGGGGSNEGLPPPGALDSFLRSQHRPLDSTPLVETKSDTRKAKLLQMHKPPPLCPLPPPAAASYSTLTTQALLNPSLFFSLAPSFLLLSFLLPSLPDFFLCLLPLRIGLYTVPFSSSLPFPSHRRFEGEVSRPAPFSRPLLLSQPFSSRKRRSAIYSFLSLVFPLYAFSFSGVF